MPIPLPDVHRASRRAGFCLLMQLALLPGYFAGAVCWGAPVASAAEASTSSNAGPYHLAAPLQAGGGGGGWDYPSVDPAAGRLYLSRGDHVSVVDLHSGELIGRIDDTPGVHAIALAPALGKGWISCGRANVVKAFSLQTLAVKDETPTGEGPDALLYDAASQRVLAFNGHGHSVTFIDAASDHALSTLALPGKPEFARSAGHGQVLVNIEDTGELALLDARAGRLLAHWPLPQCDSPSGLAVDNRHHRAFSACDNRLLVVTDSRNGKTIASLPIGAGVDGADFDPIHHLIFSANGEGSLSVIRERDADHYEPLQTLPTRRSARTLVLDPTSGRIYLPAAELGPAPPATAANPTPRPVAVEGSFKVIVAEPVTAP